MRSALVFCGGESLRMGTDKATLLFHGETLVARMSRLASAAADEVVWVARPGQPLPPTTATVVRDAEEGLGPLSALATGLRAASGDLVFVTACDTPLLQPAVAARLFDLIGGYDACVPVRDGFTMTLCAVYRRTVAGEAGRLVAARQLAVRGLLDRLNVRRVDAAVFRDIDPQLDSFLSCDTPAQLADAARRATNLPL